MLIVGDKKNCGNYMMQQIASSLHLVGAKARILSPEYQLNPVLILSFPSFHFVVTMKEYTLNFLFLEHN